MLDVAFVRRAAKQNHFAVAVEPHQTIAILAEINTQDRNVFFRNPFPSRRWSQQNTPRGEGQAIPYVTDCPNFSRERTQYEHDRPQSR